MKAAVLGGGVIGGGWVARLREYGHDVRVFDPDPEAASRLDVVLENADLAYRSLADLPRGRPGDVTFAGSLAEAVGDAELIIEAVPERVEVKRAVYAEIEVAGAMGIIASSTSGILPSDLQAQMAHPERLLVAHPFNPVYLLPLVELVAGEQTDSATVDRMTEIATTIGMSPLRVRKEIPAFIADRFLEAVWREALWLVKDGVATTAEIDDAIRLGFGLRWAQMGLFETYRVAGGEAGMRHFIAQFGPCLAWPWTKLMDVPELDEDLIAKIADQSDAQSGHMSISELERARDANLVAILRALKARDWGAGAVLAVQDAVAALDLPERDGLPVTLVRQVPADWTDYNGHMNEARYLDAFCAASDRLMEMIGADGDYISSGKSYFTAETHIRHLHEARMGDTLIATSQVLDGSGEKLHVFHRLWRDDDLIATGEHMLIHVDLETRRACLPEPAIAGALTDMAIAHDRMPRPDGAGATVGRRAGRSGHDGGEP